MRSEVYLWQAACDAALSESDPTQVIGRIYYALYTLERRYAGWGSNPGTSAELIAIQKSISALTWLSAGAKKYLS